MDPNITHEGSVVLCRSHRWLVEKLEPAEHPAGVQNHGKRLVHVDVPWNPGRTEQRNGRIDRNLQRAPHVYCNSFMPPQRPADTVLDAMVRKTDQICSEQGCPQPVMIRDLQEVNADRVHLHLEHPLVRRRLNRFLMRGVQSDALSRAFRAARYASAPFRGKLATTKHITRKR